MDNNKDKNTTFNPADVVENLKPEAKDAPTSTVESKDKVKVISTPTKTENHKPTSEVKNEVKVVAPAASSKPVKRKTTSSERAYDSLVGYLEKFKKAKYNSPDKITALEGIVTLVMKYPKKIILDTILEFFMENRKAEFLDEYHALQGIVTCNQDMSIKIRMLYSIMFSLANHTASKKTVSIEMVKSVFQKEDLSVWLTMQLRGR